MMGIYKIFNKLDGKFYIGSSTNIQNRLNWHLKDLRLNKHHNWHLQAVYNKYGNVFGAEVLMTCRKKDLIKNEQHFIDTLKPQYNVCKIAGYRKKIKKKNKKITVIRYHRR